MALSIKQDEFTLPKMLDTILSRIFYRNRSAFTETIKFAVLLFSFCSASQWDIHQLNFVSRKYRVSAFHQVIQVNYS